MEDIVARQQEETRLFPRKRAAVNGLGAFISSHKSLLNHVQPCWRSVVGGVDVAMVDIKLRCWLNIAFRRGNYIRENKQTSLKA